VRHRAPLRATPVPVDRAFWALRDKPAAGPRPRSNGLHMEGGALTRGARAPRSLDRGQSCPCGCTRRCRTLHRELISRRSRSPEGPPDWSLTHRVQLAFAGELDLLGSPASWVSAGPCAYG